MNAGECTLKNEFAFLYRMYSFYKKELLNNEELITKAKTRIKEKEISRNEIKEMAIQVHNKKIQSFYYFYAMMDAFFSLLEYLCVLLLAMDEKFMPSNENIQKFIFDTNWTEKYNRIFQDADIKYKKDIINFILLKRNIGIHLHMGLLKRMEIRFLSMCQE